jgi:hypothetical protein
MKNINLNKSSHNPKFNVLCLARDISIWRHSSFILFIKYHYPSIHTSVHPSIHPSIYLSLYIYGTTALVNLCRLFSFLILHTVGRTPRTGDEPVPRQLPTHTGQYKQNKRTQTSAPRVGFEPTIPVFERAKTVHSLDRATIVIGHYISVG